MVSLHDVLQRSVVGTIDDPDYSFALPELSDWHSIVSSTAAEKQRLEFVGDAVMHLSVALYLYRLFPDASPGLYTSIRSAVNANATFTHLMAKAGAFELPSQSRSTKAAADSFEVIIAALYLERGFAGVCDWVHDQYAPLIASARESYDKCQTSSDRDLPFWSYNPSLKKIRLSGSSGRSTPRRTLMARRVVDRMKSKGKVKLYLPTKKSKHFLKKRTSEPQKLSSLVIDLTADSEYDEGTTQGNAGYVSHPTVEPLDALRYLKPPFGVSLHSGQSHKPTDLQRLPKQGSARPAALPQAFLEPPSSTSILSDHISSTVSRAPVEFLGSSHLSLLPQTDNTYPPSGTNRNPIVINDSETED